MLVEVPKTSMVVTGKGQTWAVSASLALAALALLISCARFNAGCMERTSHPRMQPAAAVVAAAVPQQRKTCCLDAIILYHKDDRRMFVDNGGFVSYKKHLLGVQKFYVLSASDSDFRHLIDDRVQWVDEKIAPFNISYFQGGKRKAGWLYQQALKFWAAAHLEITCNDVLVLDSDSLWIRDMDVRIPVIQASEDGLSQRAVTQAPVTGLEACNLGLPFKYMYCLSSRESGAWVQDIKEYGYPQFVSWFLGTPKVWADTHTAISHWQVMQRDVVLTMEASLLQRGLGSLQDAIKTYGRKFGGVSEYEAYFSFAWTHYRERMQPVSLPFINRSPTRCNQNDTDMINAYRIQTPVVYFTCHDHFKTDFPINCALQNCSPGNATIAKAAV